MKKTHWMFLPRGALRPPPPPVVLGCARVVQKVRTSSALFFSSVTKGGKIQNGSGLYAFVPPPCDKYSMRSAESQCECIMVSARCGGGEGGRGEGGVCVCVYVYVTLALQPKDDGIQVIFSPPFSSPSQDCNEMWELGRNCAALFAVPSPPPNPHPRPLLAPAVCVCVCL